MPDSASASKGDMLIVDIDVHLHESPAELAPYCEKPWRRALESQTGAAKPYMAPPYTPLDAPFPDDVAYRECTTPEQMRAGLDKLGVDIGVLFPDNLLRIAMLPDRAYAAALMRAYNSWMLDRWCARDSSLKGALMIAPQDPQASAREIERYANESNIAGIYLPTAGLDPLYGNRVYDPLWQAAQDAGLPVLLHSVECVFPVFPFQLQGYETSLARHAFSHPLAMMANMLSIINTGMMVRFPQLKIAFTEGGVSWVPFMMYRLDKEYTERRREVPFLQERPSAYIRRFYYATQPIEEPETMRDLVTVFQLFGGEDNVMFASDWPHHDFDHPSKILQAPFSPEAKRKIMGENAVRFFNLKDVKAR
ncbi:MAG: amidohydrolase family protein [Anaerolineales bacterium]